jgi:hypothetical protein
MLFDHIPLEVINLFERHPKYQLNFVEYALAEDIDIPDKLKVKFLADLIDLHPERVIKVLKLYKFPFDESISLCKQYKNREGVAYLYTRSGRIKEAV